MDRLWLANEFKQGKSLQQVAAEVGRHPSTVGYWAKKFGLQPAGAAKFGRRGPPDRAMLERMAAEGRSLREMAETLDRSIATIRHWLGRWDVERPPRRSVDPATAPQVVERHCPQHGLTAFRLDRRGSYRCKLCGQERVAERRRRVKRILVEQAGGSCVACGYDACQAALQFHHLDPTKKSFVLSRQGVTRSLAEAMEEARKCVLLCANCHAEVEAGHRTLGTNGSLGTAA